MANQFERRCGLAESPVEVGLALGFAVNISFTAEANQGHVDSIRRRAAHYSGYDHAFWCWTFSHAQTLRGWCFFPLRTNASSRTCSPNSQRFRESISTLLDEG